MSDRPMRLKYETKMKIILCFFLLNITAVSVFGQSVELRGILGQSVKFPAAVKKRGFLMYGTLRIGTVDSGIFMRSRNENYRYRLQWDSSTGFFSLSGLTMEDIGEYKVRNTDQNINTDFQLNVYTVSVFGKSQELNGIVGKSIEFIYAVKPSGGLIYSGEAIGDVTSGSFKTPHIEKYKGRLQWDSSTGYFSLSGLRLEDSGVYNVQNDGQTSVSTFSLTVWIPVSKPHLNVTHNEYRCTILCTVDRGTGATLSWYREGEKESYGSSPVESAPHLYLPLSVERSGTYTCKAKNSVSNEKASVTVGAHCTAPSGFSTGIIVASVIAAVAVLIAVVFAVLYHRIRRGIPGFIRRCLGSEGRNIMTSSPQTDVPLKQATREVGEP